MSNFNFFLSDPPVLQPLHRWRGAAMTLEE